MFPQIKSEKQVVDYHDYNLISSLDKKLHFVAKARGSGSAAGRTFYIDEYTKESLTDKEMSGLISLMDKNYFVFSPINTSMGFSVGYALIDPETQKPLLKFKDSQLPKDYSFEKLSKYFMNPNNLEKAKSLGVNIVNSKGHYEY